MTESEKPKNHPDKSTGQSEDLNRRDFLNEVAFSALGVAGLGSAVVSYRYFSPNVLFEPPTKFRAGSPDLYPINTVTYLPEQQVYVVRTPDGFYAVQAICTHLGCITQWKPERDRIECPCHGSKFTKTGVKIEGPAPLPLPHYQITLTVDAELQVDKLEVINPTQVLKV
jgi:cytochrome b6-f complex iron-sulfur subunit